MHRINKHALPQHTRVNSDRNDSYCNARQSVTIVRYTAALTIVCQVSMHACIYYRQIFKEKEKKLNWTISDEMLVYTIQSKNLDSFFLNIIYMHL